MLTYNYFRHHVQNEMDELLHEATWQPACDLSELKNHFLISIEMPGIPKDQIRIESQSRQLTVSGERTPDGNGQDLQTRYTERQYGKFQRTFTLPESADLNSIEASYEDGVLRIVVQKTEASKPRQIKITNVSRSNFFDRLIGPATKEKSELENT